MSNRPNHPIYAAFYRVMSASMEAGPIGAARRDVVSRASGVVVDIGSGLGANLAHLGPQVAEIHLVEPDPHMLKRLRTRAPEFATIHAIGAERLPFETGSADTVLATLTLCSVRDPAAVAAEIHRVLRPGGRALVLEHVRAPRPENARRQDRLERPWGWVSGGCHPNRDTAAVLAAAGFEVSTLSQQVFPGPKILRSWIGGTLTRA